MSSAEALTPKEFGLIEGEPGTGKTTIALQYLLEANPTRRDRPYVTLSESERELRVVAKRHGWSIDQLSGVELVPPEASLDPDRELTLFHPSELELSETSKVEYWIASTRSNRNALCSTAFRDAFVGTELITLIVGQILALKHFFTGENARCSLPGRFFIGRGGPSAP